MRDRIIAQMRAVDQSLSYCSKKNPRRRELLERKDLLLRNLREQKIRIKEANKSFHDGSYDNHIISDHALVRWLERKHGLDMKELKDRMLTDSLRAALDGPDTYHSDGEMVYVLRGGQVITCIKAQRLPGEAAA